MATHLDETFLATTERELRGWIVTGTIQPGTWLREEALAKRLGVSRTPVREACTRLANEGLLERVPRRGFRTYDLDPAELEEVYPVLVSLEVLALESMRDPREALVADLESLNGEDAEFADDAGAFYDHDIAWHARLVAGSRNSVLMDLHQQLTLRVARYIHVYWNASADWQRSASEHKRITIALAQDEVELACSLLRSHRRQGLLRIRGLMEAR